MRPILTPDQEVLCATLVGLNDGGARRAWVSLPLGAGKHTATAAAISWVVRYGPIKHVLYVTSRALVTQVAPGDIPSQLLRAKYREAKSFHGVTVVSHAALRDGFDTWVQYGGFDLIVIDGVPHHLWGTTKLGGAVRTVLTWPTKVWLIGGWV